MIKPRQVTRGDYCHNRAACTAKQKVDPAQTVCLICNNFLPVYPGVDPLALAKMRGLEIGDDAIKTAMAWSPPKAKTPPKRGRPRKFQTPGAGLKRCSRSDCENPVLPADTDHFFRDKNHEDGLMSHCKKCHNKACARSYKRRVILKGA